MLEYFGGLHLRAFALQEPSIPVRWWKELLRRRTNTRINLTMHHVPPSHEERLCARNSYYAIRCGEVYRHTNYGHNGIIFDNQVQHFDTGEGEVVALVDVEWYTFPIVLMNNGVQLSLTFNNSSRIASSRHQLRDFELHL